MPFVKGQSGNPKGRPYGTVSVVTAIKRKLKEVDPKDKRAYLDKLVDVIIENALKRKDVKMIKDIIDRVDGKPRQNIGLDGGRENEPIKVEISEVIAKKNAITPDTETGSR